MMKNKSSLENLNELEDIERRQLNNTLDSIRKTVEYDPHGFGKLYKLKKYQRDNILIGNDDLVTLKYGGKELFQKQREVLGYIIFRQAFYGLTPTYKEIANYMKISPATVQSHVESLIKKNYLISKKKKAGFRVRAEIRLYQFIN